MTAAVFRREEDSDRLNPAGILDPAGIAAQREYVAKAATSAKPSSRAQSPPQLTAQAGAREDDDFLDHGVRWRHRTLAAADLLDTVRIRENIQIDADELCEPQIEGLL
jgi:hypothetical protein